MDTVLNAQFRSDGYIVKRHFFSPEEVARAVNIVTDAQPKGGVKSRLDKIGLTFKENIYYDNPTVQKFISQKKIVDLLAPLIGPDFWVRWDQLVSKAPGGAEFPWHQDNGYNNLKDEHYQLWIALTPSHPENGGLWLIPGSHKKGLLPHRSVDKHKVWSGRVDHEVPIIADPGDVVVFSSLMLHRTTPNTVSYPRHAYVVEYMSNEHFDPFIMPPYFMAAREGKPDPKFVYFYQGRLSPGNAIKYLKPRLKRGVLSAGRRIRRNFTQKGI